MALQRIEAGAVGGDLGLGDVGAIGEVGREADTVEIGQAEDFEMGGVERGHAKRIGQRARLVAQEADMLGGRSRWKTRTARISPGKR
ncbi:hypothetical protein ACFSZS_27220 [Seohaeicola zhoushanensis]